MKQIKHLIDHAEQLYSLAEIDQALQTLASELNRDYAELQPLLLCVLNGAVITAGQLLPKLTFPLQLDYIHVSRYGDKTVGGELRWQAEPSQSLHCRDVLLIEDIFDEGDTLTALRDYCQQAGVASVRCLALVNKLHQRKRSVLPEYLGLSVPDRYVFGFGMDVEGYGRNAPGIFALPESDS